MCAEWSYQKSRTSLASQVGSILSGAEQIECSLNEFKAASTDEDREEARSCLGCAIDEVSVSTFHLTARLIQDGILLREQVMPMNPAQKEAEDDGFCHGLLAFRPEARSEPEDPPAPSAPYDTEDDLRKHWEMGWSQGWRRGYGMNARRTRDGAA